MKSLLFSDTLKGTTFENIEAGEAGYHGIDINQNAPFGEYSIKVFLNYTDNAGINISKEFDFNIYYIQCFQVLDVILPTTENKVFSLKIEVLNPLSELTIELGAHGGIEVEDNSFYMSNVEKGVYYFETKILRKDGPIDTPWAYYHIIGWIDGRFIELYNDTTIKKIDWDSNVNDDQSQTDSIIDKNKMIASIIFVISILIIFNYLYYFTHNRNEY